MLVNEDSADQFTKKSLDGGVEGNIKMRLFPSTNIHIFFCTSNITLASVCFLGSSLLFLSIPNVHAVPNLWSWPGLHPFSHPKSPRILGSTSEKILTSGSSSIFPLPCLGLEFIISQEGSYTLHSSTGCPSLSPSLSLKNNLPGLPWWCSG